MSFESLKRVIGSCVVVDKSGAEVSIDSLTRGKKLIGLYFTISAHNAHKSQNPPFTPQLIEKYNEINSDGKVFEIVFVSTDMDAIGCAATYEPMPWLLLSYAGGKSSRQVRYHLRAGSLRGESSLLLFDEEGELRCFDGKDLIMGVPLDNMRKVVNEQNLNSGGCCIIS